jgi:four helix bundle protein
MREQGSGFRVQEEGGQSFRHVEDLVVYQRLCDLHLEVCDLTHTWPSEERYELGAQARRSSNSSPAQLAEKHDDRHIRNKVEGVNRARGEAAETVHHLFIARRKDYLTQENYLGIRERYTECIKMLNGLERALERHLPEEERRWHVAEDSPDYGTLPDPLP